MAKLTPDQIKEVKAQGFLINRGTSLFSGRLVPKGTTFSAQDLKAIGEMADIYGNGTVAFTTRLCAEIIGIPYQDIPAIQAFAADHDLYFGGTGAKIRPVTACKGTTCIYGNYDTQALAKKIHEDYYLGWSDKKLPHKFKIAVGGCPNSCLKPSLNDFGIEGHKVPNYQPDLCKGCKICQCEKSCPSKAISMIDGKMHIDDSKCLTCGVCTGKCPFHAVSHESETMYQIYVGGTWGKKTRMGTKLSRLVTYDEIFPLLEKTILWFEENARDKERLGMMIDRLGEKALEKALFGND